VTTPRAAAIYARISSDQDGRGLGVARQVEDCRKLASERGWVVAEEYVDNDVSAYSGKTRPAYRRMLADLAAGERDAVIVYKLDRLHRRRIE
jgi:site-specific DNA recombinase